MIVGDDHCHVFHYKEYEKRRLPQSLQATSRFYLQPIKNPNCEIWYRNAHIGKNTIGSIAKKVFGNAGLNSSRKSNHSARKQAYNVYYMSVFHRLMYNNFPGKKTCNL